MSYLENAKTYTGNDLSTIFFRPMLSGPTASDLGVRVLYNMPVPTVVQLWEAQKNVLRTLDASTSTWNGGSAAKKLQKKLDLKRVKAEMSYSAADYYSLVYERISGSAEVNMGDLTGTELETAETEMFRRSIAEGIRSTMWAGDVTQNTCNTFDGFIKQVHGSALAGDSPSVKYSSLADPTDAPALFEAVLKASDPTLLDRKAEGQLAFFVSTDVYEAYERHLDEMGAEAAYVDYINGRKALMYHGIAVVDPRIGTYLKDHALLPESFCLLTDRRNLVVAVNTSDFPGTEIRMWYNPDEMENRQRAVFMITADVIDNAMLTFAYRD